MITFMLNPFMKTTLLFFSIIIIISCNRNNTTELTLNSSDVTAVYGMNQETTVLSEAIDQITHATTEAQKHLSSPCFYILASSQFI